MPRNTILALLTTMTSLTMAADLGAGHSHSVGRYLGVGWSDGYHSRAFCPPKRPIMHAAPQPAQPLPWWMIPAEDAEGLPKTAPQEQLPDPAATPGSSLFRQPGEGSSVQPYSAPSIMR